ncbi:MAG TPA: AarF/UbiB family protein, partial [Kofleriaceae bacterium]
MVWYVLLAVLAVLFVLSVALPVPRRIWAFSLLTAKYIWLWFLDVIQVRRLWFALTGKTNKYVKLTRPVLLRMFCEDLGPTFIKFGQIIASSAGMFPDAYVKEFQKVLDRVKPFPFEDVKRTLDEELGAEKAAHLIDIQPKQLASASIAQVHTAKLRDGTPVVIKVQRPGIIARCMADMKIMRKVAAIVQRFKKNADLANPVGIVDDFTKTLTEELDFRRVASQPMGTRNRLSVPMLSCVMGYMPCSMGRSSGPRNTSENMRWRGVSRKSETLINSTLTAPQRGCSSTKLLFRFSANLAWLQFSNMWKFPLY